MYFLWLEIKILLRLDEATVEDILFFLTKLARFYFVLTALGAYNVFSVYDLLRRRDGCAYFYTELILFGCFLLTLVVLVSFNSSNNFVVQQQSLHIVMLCCTILWLLYFTTTIFSIILKSQNLSQQQQISVDIRISTNCAQMFIIGGLLFILQNLRTKLQARLDAHNPHLGLIEVDIRSKSSSFSSQVSRSPERIVP